MSAKADQLLSHLEQWQVVGQAGQPCHGDIMTAVRPEANVRKNDRIAAIQVTLQVLNRYSSFHIVYASFYTDIVEQV